MTLLPPVVRGWPAVLRTGAATHAPATVAEALARIRAEALFWPAPRRGAARPRILAVGAEGLRRARARHNDAAIGRCADPADVDPVRLEAVFAPPDVATALWALIGGLDPDAPPEAAASALAAAEGVSPWGGDPVGLLEAVEAQALLAAAARRAGGPLRLVGMSPWKRRCLRPFLTGPDGPPRRARSLADARAAGGAPVLWGAAEMGAAPADVLRVEDGFLRSVGLGLRHVPPLSLAIHPGPPHFDATRRNAFDETVASARFEPALLARAARLRERIVSLGLTKYNLADAETSTPLPTVEGRERVLAAGQVSTDASIRLGATGVRCDADLLRATRARFPAAFIVYRPHPDVLTGLRPGRAAPEEVARFADHVAAGSSAEACLAWADRVAAVTSLIGFEALLRGKRATVFGRPFYAGWGLTDDVDPPARDRRLTLDELTAAALILHASYVDPGCGLPASPEVALDALAQARAAETGLRARLRRTWRGVASTVLNRL